MTDRISAEEQGRRIAELRVRKGLSQEMLAELLGVDAGTIGRWERGSQRIRSRNLVAVASALGAGLDQLQGVATDDEPDRHDASTGQQRDLRVVDLVAWLAETSGRSFSATYQDVASTVDQLEAEPVPRRHERNYGRASIGRQDLANAVADYYDVDGRGGGFYSALVGGRPLTLTIWVDDAWLGLNIDLRDDQGQGALGSRSTSAALPITDTVYRAGVARLADAEANSRVLVNNPMYRLMSIDVSTAGLNPSFALATFADYALRNGLMELETIDALATTSGRRLSAATPTPVRDSLLPSLTAARDLESYFCTGGPVALFAAARPATAGHPADYVLLVQQRGQHVMDIPGKLSTVPKGWHQPIGEASSEARLGTTLLREFEEELLGREDLEQMSPESRRTADPMHWERHPEAMLPLLRKPENFHIRCTGFGLNLLSGTYEVPCLIVINDEDWWGKWGHQIAGNWETMSIDSVSSADTEGLTSLIHDPRWSNEGLFAFLEGLRCLDELDGRGRVAAPPIQAGNR